MQPALTNVVPEVERTRPRLVEDDQHVVLYGMTWKDERPTQSQAVRALRAAMR